MGEMNSLLFIYLAFLLSNLISKKNASSMSSQETLIHITECLNSHRIELIDELISKHHNSQENASINDILDEPLYPSIYEFLAFSIKSSLSSLWKRSPL